MLIVVSHLEMVGFGGTESYVLTVAEGLERLGHDVVVHAPEVGPSAAFARERGVRVVAGEAELPARCDAVFAQDAVTAYALARRYPDAARVFVAHSGAFAVQSPPQLEDACHGVVVMNDRLRKRTEGLARRLPVARLRQPIDLQRFCFQTMNVGQQRPPRVLLLSNYTTPARASMVEHACAAAGLELRRVGAKTVATPTPEHEIASAEIVLTLGRGALEAMAGGRAAYVFGDAGGDGWVTPDTYAALEADGFSGRALGEAIGADRLAADLAGWTEELGELGRDLACTHHAANDHCLQLLELVERLGRAHPADPEAAAELARLARLEWKQNMGARQAAVQTDAARAESYRLGVETHELRQELAAAQATLAAVESARRAETDALRDELTRLRGTRRYRAAGLLAKPLDRLRALRGSRAGRPGRSGPLRARSPGSS